MSLEILASWQFQDLWHRTEDILPFSKCFCMYIGGGGGLGEVCVRGGVIILSGSLLSFVLR